MEDVYKELLDLRRRVMLLETREALTGGDHSGGNYTEVKADGTIVLHGTATAWDDIVVHPVVKSAGVNSPAWTKLIDNAAGTSVGVFRYMFTDEIASAEKEIGFAFEFHHSWAQSAVYIHVHWVGTVADTTAAPRWGLEYGWVNQGRAYTDSVIVYSDGSNYTSGTATEANVVALKHYISKFAAITPGAGTQDGISSILIGRLFRNSSNAADTYNAAANACALLSIDVHIEKNTLGSATEYVK